MTKPKSSAPPSATPPASDQPTYRSNPEVDVKIDSYIKENPKFWSYLQGMPRERLERSLVLNEIRKVDQQQRVKESVMKQVDRDPAMKQAYETLVKHVPEELRDDVIVQLARQARRTVARTQSQAQTVGV